MIPIIWARKSAQKTKKYYDEHPDEAKTKLAIAKEKNKNRFSFFDFKKIDSQEKAKKILHDAGNLFLFMGFLMIVVGLLLENLKTFYIDAIIWFIAGYLIRQYQSIFASFFVLGWSTLTLFITIYNRVMGASFGGKNIALAILVLLGAVRACQASYYYRKFKNQTL